MINRNSSSNKLIIVCGLSFSGKSTLGKAISERFDYRQVDVDETKFNLYGLNIKDNNLSHKQWARIYKETDKQIMTYLKSGNSVVDASRNFRKAERNQIKKLANKMKIKVLTIYVNTPESIVRQRWTKNRKKQTRRDVTNKDFEEIISVMEPPTTDEKALIFNYKDNINDWLTKYADIL